MECVGCGGNGMPSQPYYGTGGGSGGAYAVTQNCALPFPILYRVALGGSQSYTNFGSSANVQLSSPGEVSAQGGGNGSNGNPMQATYFYPNGFVGGIGGSGEGNLSPTNSAGGGGAAGPSGPGGTGSAGGSGNYTGGTANNGTVPGGTGGTGVVTNGNSGTEWGAYGCGSGGGGTYQTASTTGNGGLYGGGAGGASGGPLGLGAQGLIVLTYVPLGSGKALIMA